MRRIRDLNFVASTIYNPQNPKIFQKNTKRGTVPLTLSSCRAIGYDNKVSDFKKIYIFLQQNRIL